VAGSKPIGYVIELNPDPITTPRLQRLRRLAAVALAQIEHTVTHARRGAVRGHIVQAHDHISHRLIDFQLQFRDRCTQNLKVLRDGIGSKDSDLPSSSR